MRKKTEDKAGLSRSTSRPKRSASSKKKAAADSAFVPTICAVCDQPLINSIQAFQDPTRNDLRKNLCMNHFLARFSSLYADQLREKIQALMADYEVKAGSWLEATKDADQLQVQDMKLLAALREISPDWRNISLDAMPEEVQVLATQRKVTSIQLMQARQQRQRCQQQLEKIETKLNKLTNAAVSEYIQQKVLLDKWKHSAGVQ